MLGKYLYDKSFLPKFLPSERTSRLIVQQGVDLNARDVEGNTALFYAKEFNNRKIAKFLENNGATL